MEPLGGYDLVYVRRRHGHPAAAARPGIRRLAEDRRAGKAQGERLHGALLLGAAGFLEGRRATTHPGALKDLEPYCSRVMTDRIVDEGSVITGGGVSSSLDLGLHVVEKLAGAEARSRIAAQMCYPYRWTP